MILPALSRPRPKPEWPSAQDYSVSNFEDALMQSKLDPAYLEAGPHSGVFVWEGWGACDKPLSPVLSAIWCMCSYHPC